MSNRFPVLTFVSTCLKIIGWLFVLFGLFYAVAAGIIKPIKQGHYFNISDAIDIGSGLGIIMSGLLTAAFGEIIGVLFAIEDNTRKTYSAVSSIKSAPKAKSVTSTLSKENSENILSADDISDPALRKKVRSLEEGICPECGVKTNKKFRRCMECSADFMQFKLSYTPIIEDL